MTGGDDRALDPDHANPRAAGGAVAGVLPVLGHAWSDRYTFRCHPGTYVAGAALCVDLRLCGAEQSGPQPTTGRAEPWGLGHANGLGGGRACRPARYRLGVHLCIHRQLR